MGLDRKFIKKDDEKPLFKQKVWRLLQILLFSVLIIFMANLNALVDLFLHPEIPYFDHEHVIVGGVIGSFSLILGLVLYFYINRLQRINKERNNILFDLSEAKEKAEESEHLKSAFLANMSHEIRTPLNGILGFAALLEEPGLTSEEQREFLKIVQRSGHRMLNLINDIVDISKIESGTMEMKFTEVNINEKLDTVYNLFNRQAGEKNIKLSVVRNLSGEDAMIETDKDKLYSVLTNLVKNAVKYTKSGTIEMGYKIRTINGSDVLENDNNVLEFYVKDTGVGIDVSRQKAIFERFIQADIKDLEARQGAGLGLAITKAYVGMLGGEIWVESMQDKGSTFYFTIPYVKLKSRQDNVQTVSVAHKKPRIEGLKVLIVEDDEVSADLMSVIMGSSGHSVLIANSGIEAIKICQENPDIDLIMMDIKMPNLDGYETTREIRKFNKKVIIIAQTAYAMTGDKEKALKAGCDDYITKPISKNDLLKLVQSYFGK